MPKYTLDPVARLSTYSSFTNTGGSSGADALSDDSDATYVRSNTPRRRTVWSVDDPVDPEGEPCLLGSSRSEICTTMLLRPTDDRGRDGVGLPSPRDSALPAVRTHQRQKRCYDGASGSADVVIR